MMNKFQSALDDLAAKKRVSPVVVATTLDDDDDENTMKATLRGLSLSLGEKVSGSTLS
jgi:hypothetical protein